MQSTKQQRRDFIKQAKKQWKLGKMSKEEFENLRKEVNEMGKHKHAEDRQRVLENSGVRTISEDNVEDLLLTDDELMELDDFEPEDL